MCFLRHQLGEIVFIACQIFGDGDGGIVSGLGDDAFDRVLDRNGLARFQLELGRSLLGGVLRDSKRAVELEPAGFKASGLAACSTAPLLPSSTIDANGGE